MITAPTDCFYVIQVQGDAAEFVAGTLCADVLNDIRSAVLISADFRSDIQAEVSMDENVAALRRRLGGDVTEVVQRNPLYAPATPDEIDDVLEGDMRSKHLSFSGMDGSPFTLKTISLTSNSEEVLQGRITYKAFDLPSYEDIVAGLSKKAN